MSYFAFNYVSKFYLAFIIFLLNDVKPNETKLKEYKLINSLFK